MNSKLFALSCLLAVAGAAPTADAEAEADPQYLAAPYHAIPAANCVTEVEILVTQTCVPSAENVCTTETVDTEEIEYEKICKEVVDTLCDAPVAHAVGYHGIGKREAEADAEADPQYFGGYAAHHVAAPVAHAVAHSVQATVKHACREVTTEHCVDNPIVKLVPVEVEHCHTVTKVACTPVENEIPKTTCEAVETTHVSHAAYAGYGGYAGYGYGK
eukprot:GFUD01067006.1.p1 GENE.GFUD01067006.1~~GFUD01067006.1.p1  ORF type:complete len:228 (+),score=46.22 GFUD01067006.1:39-686(+)